MTVDLEGQTVTGPAGERDPLRDRRLPQAGLLTGQDEVEMTLARAPAIEAFEARRRDEMPWLG